MMSIQISLVQLLHETNLSGQINNVNKADWQNFTTETSLSGQINDVDTKLTGKITTAETNLSGQINDVDTKLTGKITTGTNQRQINDVDTKLTGSATAETTLQNEINEVQTVVKKLDSSSLLHQSLPH